MKNGCEYCNGYNMGSKPLTDSIMVAHPLAIEVLVDGGFLYVFHQDGNKAVIGIHYCPMCGREV